MVEPIVVSEEENPSESREEEGPEAPMSPLRAGSKALLALSRMQRMYEAKQKAVEEAMDAFGKAVSTEVPQLEMQRINARLEKAQESARRLEELKESVDTKYERAKDTLEKYTAATDTQKSEDEVRRLSEECEAARLAVEAEAEAKLKRYEELRGPAALEIDRMLKKAERAEAKLRKELAQKDAQQQRRRNSFDQQRKDQQRAQRVSPSNHAAVRSHTPKVNGITHSNSLPMKPIPRPASSSSSPTTNSSRSNSVSDGLKSTDPTLPSAASSTSSLTLKTKANTTPAAPTAAAATTRQAPKTKTTAGIIPKAAKAASKKTIPIPLPR